MFEKEVSSLRLKNLVLKMAENLEDVNKFADQLDRNRIQ